ncbi:hypothetical protein D3C71_2082600 [compost metagenome]
MTPVSGSMLSPAGRPVAVNVSLSPVARSASLKWLDTSTLTTVCESSPFWLAIAVDVGPVLVPVTVTVNVADDVPPSPSDTV